MEGDDYMLGQWYKKRRYSKPSQKSMSSSSSPIAVNESTFENKTDLGPILKDLEANVHALQSVLKNCADVVFHSLQLGNGKRAVLIYIENISNIGEMDKNVLSPLIQGTQDISDVEDVAKLLPISKVNILINLDECIKDFLQGQPVILINGFTQGLSMGVQEWARRSIEEPTAESVIRGPREGFIETVAVNMSMIRRRIHSPYLKFENMSIGTFSRTSVILSYIEGVVDPSLVEEVRSRLSRIKIDGILETGYIEEYIEDNWISPFPQLLNTERPDVVSANLLEGRIAILVDGTPFVMIAPAPFYTLFQSSEDSYQRWIIATPLLILRMFFLIISLILPSLYVASVSFHQEMIPTALIISIASYRDLVPFPVLIEALLLEGIFEILREAGIRLPKQIGSAVSIVGALVIGQAAVQAGLVSPFMVIIVAITGIASFSTPNYALGQTFRLLRFPLVVLAGTLGFLGVLFGLIAISIHLCNLRSFGVPYLSPIAPLQIKELKSTIVRVPRWMMKTRPRLTGEVNVIREGTNQKSGVLNDEDTKEGEDAHD